MAKRQTAEAAEERETPALSVIERRLQGGDPFRISAKPIPLKRPALWMLRWENADISPDHLWEVINVLGWEYARPDDLACEVDEIGASERDGRIVRGERGQEVLVKMRQVDYAALQKRQTEENITRTFNPSKLKQTMVAQAGQDLGDQAASYLQRSVSPQIEDSRELVKLDE